MLAEWELVNMVRNEWSRYVQRVTMIDVTCLDSLWTTRDTVRPPML